MRRHRIGRACLLVALALAAAGCTPISWTRVTINRPLHARDIAFIAPGRTTWRDVTARLGMPGDLSLLPDGFVASYFYYDTADFGVDFGWPLGFVGPVAKLPHQMQVGDTGIGTDMLQIGVDQDGHVRFAAFVQGKRAGRFKSLPTDN
ncbi:MAG: hypothetical protein M0Z28_24055 [Rhodospirillales bacterium]|nr:hypothetical protein [Rhodospirillales bacterium]